MWKDTRYERWKEIRVCHALKMERKRLVYGKEI